MTTAAPQVTLAPGKAMLIGEYAVLDGAPALVAAVTCFARARLLPAGGAPASPFITEAMARAAAALREIEAPPAGAWAAGVPVPLVDTEDFLHDGHKLGVGSSAAATVAAVGALFAAAGLEVAGHRPAIARAAGLAHDAAQGVRGSGADVLAAAYGGVRALHAAAPDEGRRPLPVRLCFVATCRSASTAALVARFRAAGPLAAPAVREMAAAAEGFLSAWRAGDAQAMLGAAERAFEAYLLLGAALGEALVTEEHALIHRAARAVGGAAKPSGAGGGDLAVVFLPAATDEEEAHLKEALGRHLPAALRPLSLRISPLGVHSTWENGPVRGVENEAT